MVFLRHFLDGQPGRQRLLVTLFGLLQAVDASTDVSFEASVDLDTGRLALLNSPGWRVRLEGLPCSYPAHLLSHTAQPRAYFLLPEDVLLLGCLQPMQKLHPDLDGVLEQIAAAVPEVKFVFVCDMTPSLTQRFLERLAKRAPQAHARVLLLARMERQDFISLAGCLDLLLDPPYFGSGVSFFEVAHTGTPLVTLEGAFLRNRLVAAAYRLIELDDPPVANDLEQLGQLAATLLLDPARRQRLRYELKAKALTRLYDRQEGVRGFEAFVREAVARQARLPST